MKPVIAVIGHKSSGKTSVVKLLVGGLKRRGLKVATAKHIPHPNFTIDREGSDTWNHRASGADVVMSVSEGELAIISRLMEPQFTLGDLLGRTGDCDVLILEGFSNLVADQKNVGKIVCLKDEGEHSYYRGFTSNILSFCTLNEAIKGVPKILGDSHQIVDVAVHYIEERRSVLKIYGAFPKIDCKKCGFKSCLEMAEAVFRKDYGVEDCPVLKAKPKLKACLKVNGVDVPLQQFVSEIVRGTVLGMISKLKAVKIEGDEEVHIEVVEP